MHFTADVEYPNRLYRVADPGTRDRAPSVEALADGGWQPCHDDEVRSMAHRLVRGDEWTGTGEQAQAFDSREVELARWNNPCAERLGGA